MSDPERTRALMRLARHRDNRPYGKRVTAAEGRDLLAWAATLPDEDILDIRNIGPAVLRWIRDNQPAEPTNTYTAPLPVPDPIRLETDTLAEVMKRTGWHVEVLWNSGGNWFTARLFSIIDKGGRRGYDGGYLVPFDDPIGASGQTPAEALANLHAAVLEWA